MAPVPASDLLPHLKEGASWWNPGRAIRQKGGKSVWSIEALLLSRTRAGKTRMIGSFVSRACCFRRARGGPRCTPPGS